MKKTAALLLAFILVLSTCALAQSCTIICLNCSVNGNTALNFDSPATYTAIAALGAGQSVSAWRLNGETVEGETNPWLVFRADGNTVVEAVISEGSAPVPAQNTSAPVLNAPAANQSVKVTAVGCTLQYLDGSSTGRGETYTELDFTKEYKNPLTGQRGKAGVGEFKVTADNPHASSIAYWVINGVRYDFVNTVKFITVTDLTYDMTIECVYKNGTAATLDESAGTGDELIVSCENAKMAHVKGTSSTGGAYFTEFDFSKEYKNAATGMLMPGGRIDVKVTGSGNGKIRYWEFNKAKLVFSSEVVYFFARGLNAKMHYVPHFDGVARQPADPGTYYNVSCTGCTFSGGGYSGAKSGRVPAGTVVTVTANYGSSYWVINGSEMLKQYSNDKGDTWYDYVVTGSVSRTVNKDYTFVAHEYIVVN